jgi:U3 small nucleolar RNA-associated protein 19
MSVKTSGRKRKFHEAEKTKPEIVLQNLYNVLWDIPMPTEEDDLKTFFGPAPSLAEGEEKKPPLLQMRLHRREFSQAWLALLRLPLSTSMYKTVLERLTYHVIPHMSDPKRLHDFLTDSYNVGGTISILALRGLFTLIHEHNL